MGFKSKKSELSVKHEKLARMHEINIFDPQAWVLRIRHESWQVYNYRISFTIYGPNNGRTYLRQSDSVNKHAQTCGKLSIQDSVYWGDNNHWLLINWFLPNNFWKIILTTSLGENSVGLSFSSSSKKGSPSLSIICKAELLPLVTEINWEKTNGKRKVVGNECTLSPNKLLLGS